MSKDATMSDHIHVPKLIPGKEQPSSKTRLLDVPFGEYCPSLAEKS